MKSDQCKLDQFKGFEIPERAMGLRKSDRLFLPLDERWYQLFRKGEKKWELRGVSNIFNTKTVKEGRTVEVRRGYSSDPLWGTINETILIDSIDEIPESILNETIPPDVRDDPEVVKFLKEYEEKYDNFILFKISLKEGC
jgi:hypothetical protein